MKKINKIYLFQKQRNLQKNTKYYKSMKYVLKKGPKQCSIMKFNRELHFSILKQK